MADAYDRPIIIKKVKKGEHAHHGGAWKIAYADFVTAMMAFFLLLWLISMTTPEQKKGLADYFAPASTSESLSGAGGVLAGRAFDTTGAKTSESVTDKAPGVISPKQTDKMILLDGGTGTNPAVDSTQKSDSQSSVTDVGSERDGEFSAAAASIRQAWQALPNLTELASNLRVEETEEGLNIQILDDTGRAMFPEGSKYPFEKTRQAIAAIAPILERLPNEIEISGHTAAGTTYSDPRYGAWELSSDRANSVRAILSEFGLSDDHFSAITGKADSEPLLPNDPYLSGNERVEITLLHAAPPVPPDLKF